MTTLLRIASMSLAALAAVPSLGAQANRLDADVDRRVPQVVQKVVAWRRDIHAPAELPSREARAADLVAQHVRSLGIEGTAGVAPTGVVGVLRRRSSPRCGEDAGAARRDRQCGSRGSRAQGAHGC